MEEIYKTIEGHPNYEISNLGNIRNKITKKYRTNVLNNKGYYDIQLDGKDYKVHRLVAKAFIPNPNNYKEINHKDENPKNNCVNNLEWCDRKYNCNYGTRNNKISIALSIYKIIEYDDYGNIKHIYNSKNSLHKLGLSSVVGAITRNTFNRYFNGSYWFTENEQFDKNRKKFQNKYEVIDLNTNEIVFVGGIVQIAKHFNTTKDTIYNKIRYKQNYLNYKLNNITDKYYE